MQAVKGKNTSPEMHVRRLLHKEGYRYRLHRKELPGCPDLVFSSKRKVIFVHGCFWHGHNCRRGARLPKSNTEYWRSKVSRNRTRDIAVGEWFGEFGWKVLVLWECELRDNAALLKRLNRFLKAR
jgi:DNA mismatch endonuclease (patch repair protein)